MGIFILVDRGFCSNPTKVRNIERFGASMALIADYRPENMDDFVMLDHSGAGHSLQIPGFMVDYDSANKIKASLESDVNVMIRASLEISNPNNEIQIGLLYSSSLDLDSQSLEAFTTLAQKSAVDRQKALLDLHIHTFACPNCPKEIKEKNCLSNGNYCAFFPKEGDIMTEGKNPEDYDNKHPETSGNLVSAWGDFTGRELLIASLEEKCYHEEIKADIEKNGLIGKVIGAEVYDHEMLFIKQMVERLAACEKSY